MPITESSELDAVRVITGQPQAIKDKPQLLADLDLAPVQRIVRDGECLDVLDKGHDDNGVWFKVKGVEQILRYPYHMTTWTRVDIGTVELFLPYLPSANL